MIIWLSIFWSLDSLSFDCLSFDHWIVYLSSIYGFRKPIWYLQTFLKSLDNNSSDPIHHGIFNCAILNMYVAIIIHTIYNIISISGSLKNIFITIFPILTYNVHAVWFYPSFISTDLNLYWHKIRSYNDNYGSMATLDQTWPETIKFDTYQRFVIGVKPVIQPIRAKTYTKVVPFKKKSSFHFVVSWQILNGME